MEVKHKKHIKKNHIKEPPCSHPLPAIFKIDHLNNSLKYAFVPFKFGIISFWTFTYN